MKVIDLTAKAPAPQTHTADIPVGQVFRGLLKGATSGQWCAGIFYKAHGSSGVRGRNRSAGGDHVIVRLDEPKLTPGYANLSLYDTVVENYEPLDVQLVIKGVNR